MLIVSLCDSPQIGRMHRDMLTEQQIFELFFTPDNYEDAQKKLKGDENDACTWTGIECDDDGKIRCLDWHDNALVLEGSINFAFFPPHTVQLSIIRQQLMGEVDLSHLSPSLVLFCLQSCAFSGTLNMEKLPRQLREFVVVNNRITEILNVHSLPETLEDIFIEEAGIQKESLDVGPLPQRCTFMSFRNTKIHRFIFENPEDRELLIV